MPQRKPVIETHPVQDIFVTELAEVEYLGNGNFRCIFVAQRTTQEGTHRSVEARLVAPAEAIRVAIFRAAKAIGLRIIGELSQVSR